jgi:SAM-dependent methyltransferase
MEGYDASTYGERRAAVYDESVAKLDVDGPVSVLAELAGGGRVLELGVGTGRLAAPLADRGLDVVGIDASPSLLARLPNTVRGVLGDFADVAVDGDFALAFCAFNTFFLLPSQEAQRRCLQNVAKRLVPGGVFVVEAFIPYGTADKRESLSVHEVEIDHVVLNVIRHDPTTQVVQMQEIHLSERGIDLYPSVFRYSWPSELDLLAELAGLRLRERWAGWGREPFGGGSREHVSVYER